LRTNNLLKALLDTNVLIPAFLFRHINYEIVQLGNRKKYLSVTCREVIDEFRFHLLFDPHFKDYQISEEKVDAYINFILSFSELATVHENISIRPPIPHSNDEPMVAKASCYKTNYLVTWNNHLLNLIRADHVFFVKPLKFMKILQPLGHIIYQLSMKIKLIFS